MAARRPGALMGCYLSTERCDSELARRTRLSWWRIIKFKRCILPSSLCRVSCVFHDCFDDCCWGQQQLDSLLSDVSRIVLP